MSRPRLLDLALAIGVLVASVWLGSLVFHNYLGGHRPPADAATSGATIAAASAPQLGYEILAVHPHDPQAYTQGLFYDGGVLYEGTGRIGRSELRRVALETGEVLQRVPLPDDVFGEGIARFGERIYQLTWRANIGFIYAAESLQLVDYFRYATEGWGLTADADHLIMSDGSASLYFLDPASLARVRTLVVRDAAGRPVDELNELEHIDGFIYANVWRRDHVLKISPATGEVVDSIDFSGLLAGERPADPEAVLNGIAWDAAGERLFVTGKLWPKLFVVRLTGGGAR
jgi:glutamine cyclotransferase